MRIIYQSPAITIREFLPHEEEDFLLLFESENVNRYLPKRTRDEYITLFRATLEAYEDAEPQGRWGIFDTADNSFIGMCLLRNFADVAGQTELGYALAEAYWGRGIASEMANALVDYARENIGGLDLIAVTDHENVGSQRVLEKAGLTRQPDLTRNEYSLAYFKL